MKLSKNWLTIIGVLTVICVLGLGLGADLVYAGDIHDYKKVKQLSKDLEKLASGLSSYFAKMESKAFISTQLEATKWKKRVVMKSFLGEAFKKGQAKKAPVKELELILDMAANVQEIESTMKNLGIALPTLEVKLPVKAHRKLLTSSQTVYVAVAPLADESEVKSITAYSNGKRITLRADKPPEVPTLVLISAEESPDPVYPLPTSKEPGEEKKEEPLVDDDFVGIPWIHILNDHENWICGLPEIYVKVKRFCFSPLGWVTNTVDLPGVNIECLWYFLGDPNPTYRFVNTWNYAPVILFEVWEADSGFHGLDDHIATFTVWWTGLPFWTYTTFSSVDAQIRVDRD